MFSSENCSEEVKTIINSSLVEIRESSQIVQGLEHLIADTKLQEAATKCKRLEPIEAVRYLQHELGITSLPTGVAFCGEEISDILFYFLMIDGNLKLDITDILQRIWPPPYEKTYSPYRLCCEVLDSTAVFGKFYMRCHYKPDVLEYLLFKRPELLFTKRSDLLMAQLVKQLPYSKMHSILLALKDEEGRTHMFSVKHYETHARLYADHGEDLCELLSIEDDNGKIAVDANTKFIAPLLIHVYLPEFREAFKNLLEKSTEAKSDPKERPERLSQNMLGWLKDQVANNRYILYRKPRVLLVYNTKNRIKADLEANSIYDAFKTTNRFDVKRIKDQLTSDILQLIEKSANELDPVSNLPPSALIVVLMSHGTIGAVEDGGGNTLRLRTIEDAMCLKGSKPANTPSHSRPKILICQACQGFSTPKNDNTTNSAASGSPRMKEAAKEAPQAYVQQADHFCLIMAGTPGKEVDRNVFIPKLAKYISHCQENEPIDRLVQNVAQQLAEENRQEPMKKLEKPIIVSTLRAEFCLANANPQFRVSRRSSV